MTKVTLDGFDVYYKTLGNGPPVVLLHGWGGCSSSFAPVMQGLANAGFTAYALDFPGHGETPAPDEPWGVKEFSELSAKWLDALNLRGRPVIAHSFGGRVAIYLSAKENAFERMILVDAAGVRPKRGLRYYRRVYAYKLGKRLAKIGFMDKLFALNARGAAAGSADYRALSEQMKGTFVRVVNEDLTPLLKDIKAPTLLVWGSQDAETPLYMARCMEKNIADAGLVVFEGAGHFSYLDEPERFMAVTRSFFKEVT